MTAASPSVLGDLGTLCGPINGNCDENGCNGIHAIDGITCVAGPYVGCPCGWNCGPDVGKCSDNNCDGDNGRCKNNYRGCTCT
ncbi:hypothetical protein BT63DRAFT_419620 [Microthyrium microscopicum]|uniref:Uncharacterized protein n=1 Tax=Microthyrium microscopicum TaxID=703497 RepID=A0A6A6UPY1_9PEZI|nr:hypothetical protein BT63DRAFT_419620 [Microthyrium microscopicum]